MDSELARMATSSATGIGAAAAREGRDARDHHRARNQRFAGGGGNDTYVLYRTAKITEVAGGGSDLIVLRNGSLELRFVMPQPMSNRPGQRPDFTGTAAANLICRERRSRNTLRGAGGNDTLSGSGGADPLFGGPATIALRGASATTFWSAAPGDGHPGRGAGSATSLRSPPWGICAGTPDAIVAFDAPGRRRATASTSPRSMRTPRVPGTRLRVRRTSAGGRGSSTTTTAARGSGQRRRGRRTRDPDRHSRRTPAQARRNAPDPARRRTFDQQRGLRRSG